MNATLEGSLESDVSPLLPPTPQKEGHPTQQPQDKTGKVCDATKVLMQNGRDDTEDDDLFLGLHGMKYPATYYTMEVESHVKPLDIETSEKRKPV